MYLWKYWRESRITFAVGMALVGLLLWAVLKIPVGSLVQGNTAPGQARADRSILIVASILTLPLAFLALTVRELRRGPRPGRRQRFVSLQPAAHRAFFVWSDWAFGMGQLLLLVLAQTRCWRWPSIALAPDSGPILLDGAPVSMPALLLHCAAGLLLTGLMFGLTYFSSVLMKSRGVLLAIGVLIVYLLAKSVVKYYWPAITLPDLTLTEFTMSPTGGASSPTISALISRFAPRVALVFPVAAQFLLQQRDVD